MKHSHPYRIRNDLPVRMAGAAGAAAFTLALFAAVTGAMPPLTVAGTEVTIVPSRIEVVGERSVPTARTSAPHVG